MIVMRKMMSKKLLGASLIPLALIACSDQKPAAQAMPPMPVNVVIVQPQNLELYSDFPARIKAVENAEVRARVTGVIQSVNYKQGGFVKAGDSLFKIDPAVYQAQYDLAKAAYLQAQASYDNASALLKRYEALVRSSAVSKQDFENAKTSAAQANAALLQAKANLEIARINLEYSDVKSPIDGETEQALATVGELVSATAGTLLTTVQNTKQVYADFSQEGSQIMRWQALSTHLKKADQASKVKVLDNAVEGQLLYTGNRIDVNTGQVSMRAIFDNAESKLVPGMFVRVRLNRGTYENALTVPVRALRASTDEAHAKVYLVSSTDKKVSLADVTVGVIQGGYALITSGVKAGDMVIVDGFDKTGPGATVTPIPINVAPAQAGINAQQGK